MQLPKVYGLLGWAVAGVMAVGAAGTAYAATGSTLTSASTKTTTVTPPSLAHPPAPRLGGPGLGGPGFGGPRPGGPGGGAAFPGLHGSYTVQRGSGYVQVDYARGTVASLNGSVLSVKSADGTTTTFQLGSATKYGAPGHKEVMTDLHAGEKVFATGTGAASSITATHVLIPPTWPAS